MRAREGSKARHGRAYLIRIQNAWPWPLCRTFEITGKVGEKGRDRLRAVFCILWSRRAVPRGGGGQQAGQHSHALRHEYGTMYG